jgi:hypothetical protein
LNSLISTPGYRHPERLSTPPTIGDECGENAGGLRHPRNRAASLDKAQDDRETVGIDQPRRQRFPGDIEHAGVTGRDRIVGYRNYAIVADEDIVRRLQIGLALENQVSVLEQITGHRLASDAAPQRGRE